MMLGTLPLNNNLAPFTDPCEPPLSSVCSHVVHVQEETVEERLSVVILFPLPTKFGSFGKRRQINDRGV